MGVVESVPIVSVFSLFLITYSVVMIISNASEERPMKI